ncbi:hypothetical protein MP228_003991 [Amoeboaphelidium protococcarum]|nr:hypothetical protein MP228_003991 [Amoeboaphelidium protococcarum]
MDMPPVFKIRNFQKIDSRTALCITLQRLADSGRLLSGQTAWQIHYTDISKVFVHVIEWIYARIRHKVKWDLQIMQPVRLSRYAQSMRAHGSPLQYCWGFYDGSLQEIARPSGPNVLQKAFYNGRHHGHGVNLQIISAPDGMIASVAGPYIGKAHDANMWNRFRTKERLDALEYPLDDGQDNQTYCIYGDKGYKFKNDRVQSPIEGNRLTEQERAFNFTMSELRVSVENCIGKCNNLWKQMTFEQKNQIQKRKVAQYMLVAMFLTNCHSCFYSNSVADRFNCFPPSIEEYMRNFGELNENEDDMEDQEE